MEYLQALTLGIVQGLTEFLPVSSSGHLIVFRELLGWEDQGLFFDVVLHFGTLLAIIIYFWQDVRKLFLAFGRMLKTRKLYDDDDKKLLVHLILATIPVVVLGFLLVDTLEVFSRNLIFVGSMLIVTSVILFMTTRKKDQTKKIEDLDARKSFVIGLFQALAIMPGISRSGSTIAAGVYQGTRRDEAARFSFLLGSIGIFAAMTLILIDVLRDGATLDWGVVVIGFLSSLVVSYLAIKYFLAFLRKRGLGIFAIYVLLVGIFLIGFEVVAQ